MNRLIAQAFEQQSLQGISTILEMTAERFKATRCALWELDHEDPRQATGKTLTILAEFIAEGEQPRSGQLAFGDPVSGLAIENGEAQFVENLEDPRLQGYKDVFVDLGVRQLAVLPVQFADARPGVLAICRRQSKGWQPECRQQLERLAPLIAGLYEVVHGNLRTKVVKEASRLLQKQAFASSRRIPTRKQIERKIQALAELIAETIPCLEVSIFLRDPAFDTSRARQIATTWKRDDPDSVLHIGSRSSNPSAWALRKGLPVLIFDLQCRGDEKLQVMDRYPGLKLPRTESLIRQTSDAERHEDATTLGPLGLLVAPVLRGRQKIGIVRCFAPTQPPLLFSRRELVLLQALNVQLADYWTSWLDRRDVEEENRAWRSLIKGINGLNALTQEELAIHAPLSDAQKRLMQRSLKILRDTLPVAQILDIRLLHEDGNLYFAETLGAAWDEGTEEEIRERLDRSFPTRDAEPQSAGAWVVQNNRLYRVRDHKKDPFYSPTFRKATMVYCAPISDGKEVLGVLDLRTTNLEGMPKNAGQIAALLGQQLGLCLAVVQRADQLAKTAEDQWREREEQKQIYEDLSHQLKTPVLHGYERIRAVVDGEVPEDRAEWNLLAVRGLSRKAVRVVTSLGLFADLAKGGPIRIDREPLELDYLVRMLIEAAADTAILMKPSKKLNFHVDRKSFQGLDLGRFKVDRALLEQAISNLLDNARKYSYPRTTVGIAGSLTKKGHLCISVTNRGLKVRGHQVKRMKSRLWRSIEAKEVSGEGTGIGLWIVDNIMQAHGGELHLKPTESGSTEVKLIFHQ